MADAFWPGRLVHTNKTLRWLRERRLVEIAGEVMTILDETALETLAGMEPPDEGAAP